MKVSLMRFVLFYGKDLQEEMEIYAEEKDLQRDGNCAACRTDRLIDYLIHTGTP